MTGKEAIAMLKRMQEPEAWEPQINEAAFEALAMAIKALKAQDMTLHMNLPEVSAEEAVEILKRNNRIELLPSAQPERKISNKEWIDFLVFQFDISRTSAKEMLHGMMQWKKEDNFKKQFNGDKNNGKIS